MKKILAVLILTSSLLTVSYAQTGTWTAVTNLAPDSSNGLMLLLTDGTVMCSTTAGPSTGVGSGWNLLTPDASGSYVNGTWKRLADMKYDRFAFSSQVLPSGKVYVAGGEYGAGGAEGGEVYNPETNTWTSCGAIPSGWNVYDAPSELLYTGNVLEGPEIGANGGQPCNSILQWNPNTLDYINENEEPGNHDEAAWLKLPDSSVIQPSMPVSQSNSNPSQDSVYRFIPQTNTWVADNLTPNNLYDQWGFEAGGGYLLPNGKAIFFGATQYNGIYTPSGNTHTKGTWAAAANFPQISSKTVSQPDAPGAMMVNGHILLCVSPEPTNHNEFNTPSYFIEYDYTTNTFTQVTATLPTVGADDLANCISQNQGFLDLPDGTVLMCSNASNNPEQYWVYTPGSAAIPQGKPTINSILPDACPSYKITGKLFNGISEGTGYGDDIQNSTNYPLVRLTNGTNVYYAKTTDWNRVGAVATDSLEDTCIFTLPTMPGGTYSLVVVANGFASNPVLFNVFEPSLAAQTNPLCNGSATGSASVSASGGITPYTYSWAPSGGTNASASNLSAGTYTVTSTDNNGCSMTTLVTITQPAAITLTATVVNIPTGEGCTGMATVNTTGGTSPYTYNWSPGGGTNDTINGKCAGTYCCLVTDKNGCTQSTCATIVISAVQNIQAGNGQINIYPNPGNGDFILQSFVSGGNSAVEIYNVLGQKVYSNNLNISQGSEFEINLSDRASGMYFYRILNESGGLLGTGKLLIQK